MDYYKRYQEIIADYNREKDRATIEATFARVVDLINNLDAEQRRAVEERLSEEELALFDLLQKETLSKAERDRVKEASRELLRALQELLPPLDQWTQKEQTQAEVKISILDHLYHLLPSPSFSDEDKAEVAEKVYHFVWQQSATGSYPSTAGSKSRQFQHGHKR
jgi:type I restriction enzyme R subunit